MADQRLIVFTDLDGTLLDHQDYSYKAAQPALNMLHKYKIPLVLASSKTSVEIAPLRKALGFEDSPAIIENGAGILQPRSNGTDAANVYDELIGVLDSMPSQLRTKFVGFSDMSAEQVSEHTGLSKVDAILAKERGFSEPGLWRGTDKELDTFLSALLDKGVSARRGGRFLTLSFGGNKADKMTEIVGQLQEVSGETSISIALGDAPNDVEMLEAADHGVIISNPSHEGIAPLKGETRGHITRSVESGPEGWNVAVLELLERYMDQ